MKTLLILAALAVSFASSAFAQDPPPPPAPAAPVAAAPVTPAPAPAAPVVAQAPAVAQKEETGEPGFVARTLAAMAGNKTINAQLTEKDATIAALTKERDDLKAQVAAQTKDLTEAGEYVRGVTNGTINPVANPAPNPVAAAAVEAVQHGTSQAVQKVGIPTEALTTPTTPPPAAAAPEAKENARLTALDAVWKNAGYDRQALVGAN